MQGHDKTIDIWPSPHFLSIQAESISQVSKRNHHTKLKTPPSSYIDIQLCTKNTNGSYNFAIKLCKNILKIRTNPLFLQLSQNLIMKSLLICTSCDPKNNLRFSFDKLFFLPQDLLVVETTSVFLLASIVFTDNHTTVHTNQKIGMIL